MIGVTAKLADQDIVREFFELFKTEWEFERPGVTYDVTIRSGSASTERSNSRLTIIYGVDPGQHNRLPKVGNISRDYRTLLFNNECLPIYGPCLSFPGASENSLVDEFSHESVIRTLRQAQQQTTVWIGYDLWKEIRYLLVSGQPEQYAAIPTLELHIKLLRDVLRQHQFGFLEVPPVPPGYKFIACLTHDVDHASIREHKLDQTIVGFLYRAAVQSVFHFCSGRKSLGDVLRNWAAVVRLPLVQLGLLPDIWSTLEKYVRIENARPSTFFIVPRSGDAGRLRDGGTAPKLRAVRYKARKLSGQLRLLMSSRHEIGLHGINAWLTTKEAIAERVSAQSAFGEGGSAAMAGVRMHWLYHDQSSAKVLDDAGFEYDSTLGYNRTVGYRSGTCQVYKPLGTKRLKELPLHVMDTALFFPECMNLRPEEAKAKIRELITNAVRFGGVLTVNWHDRSIAPERLWHRIYADLVEELEENGAWFATAGQTVSWFGKRRSAKFHAAAGDDGINRVRVSLDCDDDELPGLRLRVHTAPDEFTDTPFNESAEIQLSLSRNRTSEIRNPQLVK